MVSLDFYDKQDFVRFVLAYLLIENIYDLVGNCVVEISENLTPKQREK